MKKNERLFLVTRTGTNDIYYIGEKKYNKQRHMWDVIEVTKEAAKKEDTGMTYDELKSALIDLKVPFKGNARKADLQALYDLEKDRI